MICNYCSIMNTIELFYCWSKKSSFFILVFHLTVFIYLVNPAIDLWPYNEDFIKQGR